MAISLLIVQVVAGCNEPLGSVGSGRLPLVISADVVGDGASDAYAKTDAVRVRVTDSSQTVVEETTLPFNPSGSGNAVFVEVDGDLVGQRLGVQVELLAADAATFSGQGSATPAIGTPASVEIFLTPIIADVDAPANVGPITAIGGTLQLDAAPVFATGDIVPGAAVSWAPLDPDIVSVSPSGLARALAEGAGRVQAIAGTASAVIQVTVQAIVVSVDVEPVEATIPVQGMLQFMAVPRDANQNALSGRAATWESTDPTVVQVNAAGVAMGVEPGTAELVATIEGVEGSAEVTVAEIVPASPSNFSAAPDQTAVFLTWEDQADNETRYEVVRVGPGSQPGGDVIALQPNTTFYVDETGTVDARFEYTIRACNDAGCGVSSVLAVFTVPEAATDPTIFTAVDYGATVIYANVLHWVDESSYATHFEIEGGFGQGAWDPLGATGGTQACPPGFAQPISPPCFTVEEYTSQPPYYYEFRIAACNDAGCSDWVEYNYGTPPPGARSRSSDHGSSGGHGPERR